MKLVHNITKFVLKLLYDATKLTFFAILTYLTIQLLHYFRRILSCYLNFTTQLLKKMPTIFFQIMISINLMRHFQNLGMKEAIS